MNELLIVICYMVILIAISPSMNKRNDVNESNVIVFSCEAPITKDEAYREELYNTVADSIIYIYKAYSHNDKRERIVELLRMMVEIGDTGDFLERHNEIHDYIFHSSA